MKFWVLLIIILNVLIGGCVSSPPEEETIGSQITFRAFRQHGDVENALSGVKIVVIDQSGEVLRVLETPENGEVQGEFTVTTDKKYAGTKNSEFELRGTVTVIAFKEGFREVVLFEVPINSYSIQSIYMEPESSTERNEPRSELGNNHRLDILELVETYSSYAK